MPREEWELPDDEQPDQRPDWHPQFGDRSQTLVFIGQQLDEGKIRARLDACLLDEQFAAHPGAWDTLPNPFPEPQLTKEMA